MKTLKIKDVMTNPAVCVNKNDTIINAAKIMQEHNIGAIPVVDDNNNLVGIVTDRDIIIRNIARELDPKDHKVSEIMTTNVKTVTPDTYVDEALEIMSEDQVRRLPVVDESKNVIGMVSLGDVATTSDFYFETGEALSEISIPCHKKHPKNNEKSH